MKPLTLQYALENKFLAVDYVKYFRPNWTDKECRDFLMKNTLYPMPVKSEDIINQLNNQLIEPEQHTVVGC